MPMYFTTNCYNDMSRVYVNKWSACLWEKLIYDSNKKKKILCLACYTESILEMLSQVEKGLFFSSYFFLDNGSFI